MFLSLFWGAFGADKFSCLNVGSQSVRAAELVAPATSTCRPFPYSMFVVFMLRQARRVRIHQFGSEHEFTHLHSSGEPSHRRITPSTPLFLVQVCEGGIFIDS